MTGITLALGATWRGATENDIDFHQWNQGKCICKCHNLLNIRLTNLFCINEPLLWQSSLKHHILITIQVNVQELP